ncbi:o-succinylbenzoate synthase [Motilimonas cestriensis]|uniref:o-succinylbenzoate synthase n=1 Tax=Motilimonas cestriensis TaxID=2742685 RepID=UPI003DA4F79E
MSMLRDIAIYRTSLTFKRPMTFAQHTLNDRDIALVKAFNIELNREVRAEIAPLPGFSPESLDQAIAEIITAVKTGQLKHQFHCASSAFAWDCLHQGITPSQVSADVPLLQGSIEQIHTQYLSLKHPTQIKLKVARLAPNIELDIIHTLVKLNPQLQIRLDANQGWDRGQGAAFVSQLPKNNIVFIEEPCAILSDSLYLAERYQLPIALDEQLQQPMWPLAAFSHQAITAFIIKPMLVGSFKRIEQLLALAKQQQKRAILSCAFESQYGLSVLATLAGKWTPNEAPGLDTKKYFCDKQNHTLNTSEMEQVWPK